MVRARIQLLACSLRAAVEERRGNVAVMFALLLPMIVGGAGLGVETTYWRYKQLQLQAAADAAAFAGGIEKRMGSASSVVTSASTQAAIQNGYEPGSILVTEPSGQANAIQVALEQDAGRFFTALFSSTPVRLRASATAVFNTANSACVLALDPTASRAAQVSGSGVLTLAGCSVMANSVAADAVNVQGAAHLTTPCIISAGGVNLTANAVQTECASAIIDAPRAADPFVNLPAIPVVTPTRPNSNGAILYPGVYTNGMNLNGPVQLSSGIYVLEGDLKITANADVTSMAGGVTIILKGAARVSMTGSPHVDITSQATGPWAGILLYGDRSSIGGLNKLTGDGTSHMTGAIYFPRQDVQYNGNFSGQNGCTQVVARTVDWTGNSTVGVDCTAYGMQPIPATTLVKLVA